MDHHPPWSDILNEVHLRLPPEKLTSAPKRAEQDQLKRNKTWIFKVKGPVYTERTSLKPAALLPLSFSPCYPWGLPLEEKGADCFARVFRCYVPSFPIYSERSAVAASRKKKKKIKFIIVCAPRGFPLGNGNLLLVVSNSKRKEKRLLFPSNRTILQRQDSLAGIQPAKSRCLAKAALWEPLIRRILGGLCVDGRHPVGAELCCCLTGNTVRRQSERVTHGDKQEAQPADSTGAKTQLGNTEAQQLTSSFHAFARYV